MRTLLEIRDRLAAEGLERRASWAASDDEAVRRSVEPRLEADYRLPFSLDVDRILHSLAYTRYIDKTQVFSFIRNDHITHRVLHVQLVSKIARTIGRYLRLNEDLIEAVALGHDIGHAPFGHTGEVFLSRLCREHGVDGFLHNVQSVRFLDRVERKGIGWNLTLQVLDGILCHDGEVHQSGIAPGERKSFADLDRLMREKSADPGLDLLPMSLEGCVVRMADTIGYIGRDIEDAIRLGLIRREDLPGEVVTVLGNTNGTIVYRLVTDLLAHSVASARIAFGSEVAEALGRLKRFNYERIYTHPAARHGMDRIETLYGRLFEQYISDLRHGRRQSVIYREFLDGMAPAYLEAHRDGEIVRDFIAGMTDRFFLEQCPRNLCPEPGVPGRNGNVTEGDGKTKEFS